MPGNDQLVRQVTKLWQNAGFNAKAYDDIAQLIWEKFICNVAFSAPCAVFEKSVRHHYRRSACSCGVLRVALEAYQVARARDINLSFNNPLDYIAAFAARVGDAKPSLYLDHLARRPSEIDAINGMVPVVASEVGLSAPYNDALTHILRSREACWKTGGGTTGDK